MSTPTEMQQDHADEQATTKKPVRMQDADEIDRLIHEGRLREMQMDAADEARQGGGIE